MKPIILLVHGGKDARTVQFYLNGEPAGVVTTNQDFTRRIRVDI